ncbi:hypothetical protein C8Q74DRAFT_413728 [Fomes fomentarius]|nr:hypothetical protein C8Q74DRAFT_413728 [Fomes fomentarius]
MHFVVHDLCLPLLLLTAGRPGTGESNVLSPRPSPSLAHSPSSSCCSRHACAFAYTRWLMTVIRRGHGLCRNHGVRVRHTSYTSSKYVMNITHLLLSVPSLRSLMHIQCSDSYFWLEDACVSFHRGRLARAASAQPRTAPGA